MKAMIVRPHDVAKIRYPLPKGLAAAAGILKGKSIDGLKYQKKVRREWEKRLQKQIKLSKKTKY